MKKGLKIAGICLVVFLLILIILPFALKGKIGGIVKSEANKMIDARLDFSKLSLSFIRSFPNASIGLEDLSLVGIGAFEGDTLLAAKELSATVNLKSLFGDSGYEISKIHLDNGLVHAIVLKDGKANWDIMKSDSTESTESDTTSGFKLSLEKVTVNNTDIYYDDDSMKVNLAIKGINLALSGDMTADNTQIKTNVTADELSFIMDNIPYLSKAKVKADVNLDADMKNMKFVLSENSLQLNEIKAAIDGWVAMPDDETIEMDLKLNAPQTQFKDILSMIPAIYAKDFQDIKTSGEATLEAFAKGKMQGDNLPAFDVKLNIANAMFQYPSLPKSVNNIVVNSHITNPGGTADKTIIDVSKFHFDMAGNPFDLTLHMSTPVSDPNFALSAIGHLNLGMIKDVYPLDSMELNGKLDANLKISSRMSYIEKEQYDKVNASGTLVLTDMKIKSSDMDDILVNKAEMSFSPQFVDLGSLSAQIGKNDIAAKGKLENFIPYALKNETLKGTLSVSSNYLNLNDFMTDDASASGQADTSSVGVIEIPRNLDFTLNGNFKKVLFDNLDMENVNGQLLVKNGKVDMKNLTMNALGGTLGVNGYYDTSKDPKQPDISLSLDIKNASFAKTFSSFVSVQKLAPIFESIAGNYSTTFNMTAPLGSDFMPVLTSLDASGLLQSTNVEVSDVKVLDVLATTLKDDKLRDLKIKDLKLPFSINDGRVTTKPFDLSFGSGKMNLSGSTGLDQSIDYTAKVDLAEKLTNGYVKNVNLKIGGTFKNPKISMDVKDIAGQALDKIAGSILGGSDSTSVSQKASEEITKQSENIRQQAKDAGDKLVAEAEKQGQKLIDEANKTKNPLAKVAAVKSAELAAQKLKDEAQKQANQLNTEAEKQIQSLSDKANSQIQQNQ